MIRLRFRRNNWIQEMMVAFIIFFIWFWWLSFFTPRSPSPPSSLVSLRSSLEEKVLDSSSSPPSNLVTSKFSLELEEKVLDSPSSFSNRALTSKNSSTSSDKEEVLEWIRTKYLTKYDPEAPTDYSQKDPKRVWYDKVWKQKMSRIVAKRLNMKVKS